MSVAFEKKRYFDVFFPAILPVLCKLMTQSGKIPLKNVILVPRWLKPDGGTSMGKYDSFNSVQDILDFATKNGPINFQLGGIFNAPPSDELKNGHKQGVLSATGPPVLDIDINDYNRENVCDCGERKIMCDKCYQHFLFPAQQVLEYLLYSVFGFKKVLFVYSGKRGMHTWILDERAWNWTKSQRKSFLAGISHDSVSIINDQYITNVIFKNRDLKTDYPKFDEAVTTDPCHLRKLPLMLHQDTMYVSILLPDTRSGVVFNTKHHYILPAELGMETVKMFVERIEQVLKEE